MKADDLLLFVGALYVGNRMDADHDFELPNGIHAEPPRLFIVEPKGDERELTEVSSRSKWRDR